MAIRPQVSNAQKGSVPFQYTIGLVHPFYTKTRLTRYLCNQISQNCTKKYQILPCEIIRFLKIVKFLVLQTKKKDPFHTKKTRLTRHLCNQISQSCTKKYQKVASTRLSLGNQNQLGNVASTRLPLTNQN